jgi:23S rRNA G2069 N7-methylase RlmK/C1962 C5-methylase RlmI
MLEEKILSNLKKLEPWIQENSIEAYRLFDGEIFKDPISIDVYGNFFHVFLYENTKFDIESLKKNTWKSLKSIYPDLKKDSVVFKIRKKQKDGSQYEKIKESKDKFVINEFGSKYFINLTDYLDTGLFLDHRKTRELFSELVKNRKRILNLFSYTGAFSITAYNSGVEYTTSVDMSNTYCKWARDNFQLNGMDSYKHLIIRDNVFFFLENMKTKNWSFDFIVIDPPTVSRSKKMLQKFDIQRDYPYLINNCLNLLNRGGQILFSTNFRKFKMDNSLLISKDIKDISLETIPEDFNDSFVHKVYLIQ